jgi:hypothetical protein
MAQFLTELRERLDLSRFPPCHSSTSILTGNLLTLMQGRTAHHFVDKLMKQVKVGIATIHFVPLVRFNIVAVADPDIINTLAPISEEKNAFIYDVYNDLSNCRAGIVAYTFSFLLSSFRVSFSVLIRHTFGMYSNCHLLHCRFSPTLQVCSPRKLPVFPGCIIERRLEISFLTAT